jgi:striatin 1/3/4
VLTGNLVGHTDAVWGLSIHNQRMQLLSCGADGLVCLWSPQNKVPLLSTFSSPEGTLISLASGYKLKPTSIAEGQPTSVDFVHNETNQMVAAYNSSHCVIYDLETGKPVTRLETSQVLQAATIGWNRNNKFVVVSG